MRVATFDGMRDGERLRQLLKDNRKTVEELADALGKSKQMVYKYQGLERFSPTVAEMVIEGLNKLGIAAVGLWAKPNLITDPAELRSLLDGIPADALRNVKKMLDADPVTKVALHALIDDRLDRRRH